MEVILVEDVPHLGSTGDLVRVAPGYGRNFLLPRSLAVVASIKSKKQFEHQKREAGFRKAAAKSKSEATAKRLNNLTVSIARKVGEQDRLFGAVTTHDIEQALIAQGVEIDRRKLVLHEPIKALGHFTVPVRLEGGLTAEIKVTVVAE